MSIIALAAAVPLVTAPAAGVSIDAAETSTLTSLVSVRPINLGISEDLPLFSNYNAKYLEEVTRLGAVGVYGVLEGFTLTAGSGTVVNIAFGRGISTASFERAAGSVSVNDNATTFIWAMPDKTIEKRLTAAVVTGGVYIGSVTTAAGVVTVIDTSGVVYLIGGTAVRYTGDSGAPNDTPTTNRPYLTITLGGAWWWTGTAYSRLPHKNATSGRLSKSVAGGSNVTLTGAEAANKIIVLTGALTGNIDVIFPANDASDWIIYNNTTGAFTLTVKCAAQTGFAIGQTKHCVAYCDGTDVRRATADN